MHDEVEENAAIIAYVRCLVSAYRTIYIVQQRNAALTRPQKNLMFDAAAQTRVAMTVLDRSSV